MQSDEEILVYHVGGPLRRYMAWVIFGPFAVGMAVVGVTSKGGDQFAGWATAGFLLLFGMGVHWLVSRARLELSVAGLKLRQVGYTLETCWTNVESLRMGQGTGSLCDQGADEEPGAAKLSSMRGVAFGFGRMPIYDRTARELLFQQRYIPIEAFAWHLRQGKLGDDLTRLCRTCKWRPGTRSQRRNPRRSSKGRIEKGWRSFLEAPRYC